MLCALKTDAPTIRMLGAPQIDLEDGKDSLVLRCEADANPPASIIWKRAGRSEIASLQVSFTVSFFMILGSFNCFSLFESIQWILIYCET